jgi:hypothetical protein
LYSSLSFFLFLPCSAFSLQFSPFSYFSHTRFLNFLLLSFIIHNFIISFPLLLLGFFLIHFLISFPFYSAFHLLSVASPFVSISLTFSAPSPSSIRLASPFLSYYNVLTYRFAH